MTGWTKIKGAAKYANMSERSIRPWLKLGLRHVRLPSGTILIKYKWVDEFLEKYEVNQTEGQQVDRIVEDVMQGMACAGIGEKILLPQV